MKLTKLMHLIGLTIVVMLMTGCAHKISLSPSLDEIRSTSIEKKVDKNVGYFISPADRQKLVETPGGGGDDVEYKPYHDVENALNTVLSKVFKGVYSIPSLDDKAYIEGKNLKYIFIPNIRTNSSSSSIFTWPPTNFMFELKCQAVDNTGKEVWVKYFKANGAAEFDEFKSNMSLSAQRATKKAFNMMLNELKNSKEFN